MTEGRKAPAARSKAGRAKGVPPLEKRPPSFQGTKNSNPLAEGSLHNKKYFCLRWNNNGSENQTAPHGRQENPFYRVVVADSRYPRDGRFIEELGTYNPLVSPSEFKVDAEKVQAWIRNGAQPTDTVKALLKKNGVL